MPKKSYKDNDWSQYEKLVMSKLDSHDTLLSEVLTQMRENNANMAEFRESMAEFKGTMSSVGCYAADIAENKKEIGEVKVSIAELNVKSGIWGAIGGVVSLAAMLLGIWIKADVATVLSEFFFHKGP